MHSGFRLRAIALAGIGLFVAAACGPSSTGTTLASTQELRVNIGTEPCCFDPGQTQWNYEAAVDRQVFEAPLKASKDFKSVVPNAADSYTIDSTGTVYTFKLHKGAKWSDGQAVKAADFVYGWQRIEDPRVAAPYASFYYIVKNAATINAMDAKNPGIDDAVQTLGVKAVDDATVAYAKYKSGELDMVNVPLADIDAVRSSPELVKVPELTVFWIDINVKAKPFDNPNVR